MEERTLTFGEKAVGLSFNPSGREDVNAIKVAFAEIITSLDAMRTVTPSGERRRMLSIAITEAQTAQMWAVKAATWSD